MIRLTKESQLLYEIRTAPAQVKPLESMLPVTAYVRVKPQLKAALAAPVTGLLRLEKPISIGSRVAKDELIATLEQTATLSDQISLESYKFERIKRRTQVRDEAEHSRQQLVAANLELNRKRKLYEAGAIPLKDMQEAEQRVAFVSAEAAHAQQNLVDLNDSLKNPVSSYQLKAPIAGIVVALEAANGQQLDAGKTIITIVDLSSVWLEAQVFEIDLPKLPQARKATFRVPAIGNNLYTIAVEKQHFFTLGSAINTATRTLPVYFEAANKDYRLRDGMAAELMIDTGDGREALIVPRAAVLADEQQQMVFVYRGGEIFEPRIVQTGAASAAGVEILSGLAAGERVVVAGLSHLRAGLAGKR
jgi:membrane fusion protein, heavy metal efflux system